MRIRVLPPELERELDLVLLNQLLPFVFNGNQYLYGTNPRWWQYEDKIGAIKVYRALSGLALKEAKDFVDAAFEQFRPIETWEER